MSGKQASSQRRSNGSSSQARHNTPFQPHKPPTSKTPRDITPERPLVQGSESRDELARTMSQHDGRRRKRSLNETFEEDDDESPPSPAKVVSSQRSIYSSDLTIVAGQKVQHTAVSAQSFQRTTAQSSQRTAHKACHNCRLPTSAKSFQVITYKACHSSLPASAQTFQATPYEACHSSHPASHHENCHHASFFSCL